MGVFSPPNWNTLKNKPNTVAGFGISDMAAQVSANERCKAWVNFNGTGTVAIRGSGNVSSITDNGVGNYTVNFTTAMADANYSTAIGTTADNIALTGLITSRVSFISAQAAGSVQIVTGYQAAAGSAATDFPTVCLSISR